jgi:hypothetical protein
MQSSLVAVRDGPWRMLDASNSTARRNTLGNVAHALVLSALILFSSLAQTVHESLVTHAICPEHGELLDVAPLHVDVSAADEAALANIDAANPSAADRDATHPHAKPSGAPAGHDECWFATLLRPGSTHWVSAPAHLVPLTRVAFNDAIRPCVRAAAIPPLSFAPKHSPPARAA